MTNNLVKGVLNKLICTTLLVLLLVNGYGYCDAETKTNDRNCSSVILINENLIGGYNKGKWLKVVDILGDTRKEMNFKVYSVNKYLGETIGKKPNKMVDDDFVEFSLVKFKGENVAVSCSWNPMPRMPKIQDTTNPSYKKIVSDILKENGIKGNLPIQIKQIIRVDLDGDGTEEVLIMAENITPLSSCAKNNQYSMLIIRKISNGIVKNFFVEKDITVTDKEYVEKTPVTYNVVGIADVNNDGVMELLVKGTYYEGTSYMLYDMKKEKVQMVLSIESGA